MRNAQFTCLFALAAPILAAITGCSTQAPFPPEPAITFVKIEPDTVRQYADSILISFRFTDGDGDIGGKRFIGDDTTNSYIYVTDNRPLAFGATTANGIATDLTPNSKKPSISGTMKVAMETPPILGFLVQSEPVSFDIVLYDRAGNKSNTITTTPVIIVP